MPFNETETQIDSYSQLCRAKSFLRINTNKNDS